MLDPKCYLEAGFLTSTVLTRQEKETIKNTLEGNSAPEVPRPFQVWNQRFMYRFYVLDFRSDLFKPKHQYYS